MFHICSGPIPSPQHHRAFVLVYQIYQSWRKVAPSQSTRRSSGSQACKRTGEVLVEGEVVAVVEAEVEATRKHRVRSSTILDGIGTSTW